MKAFSFIVNSIYLSLWFSRGQLQLAEAGRYARNWSLLVRK